MCKTVLAVKTCSKLVTSARLMGWKMLQCVWLLLWVIPHFHSNYRSYWN